MTASTLWQRFSMKERKRWADLYSRPTSCSSTTEGSRSQNIASKSNSEVTEATPQSLTQKTSKPMRSDETASSPSSQIITLAPTTLRESLCQRNSASVIQSTI